MAHVEQSLISPHDLPCWNVHRRFPRFSTIADEYDPCYSRRSPLLSEGWTSVVDWDVIHPWTHDRDCGRRPLKTRRSSYEEIDWGFWPMASPSNRAEPAKIRSTETTMLCELVSWIWSEIVCERLPDWPTNGIENEDKLSSFFEVSTNLYQNRRDYQTVN